MHDTASLIQALHRMNARDFNGDPALASLAMDAEMVAENNSSLNEPTQNRWKHLAEEYEEAFLQAFGIIQDALQGHKVEEGELIAACQALETFVADDILCTRQNAEMVHENMTSMKRFGTTNPLFAELLAQTMPDTDRKQIGRMAESSSGQSGGKALSEEERAAKWEARFQEEMQSLDDDQSRLAWLILWQQAWNNEVSPLLKGWSK
jgi:hypothetical protein